MASVREYLEKMDTERLQYILSREVYGWDNNALSTIYLICAVLSEREPYRGDPKDIFLDFAARYADNKLLAEQ